MAGVESLSLEEQNEKTGLCLECHTGVVMDEETKKRVRERLYDVIDNKYCGQCGNPLYRTKK